MSHLTIKRRRTESLRSKMHSQQSKVLPPRQSLGRILNDSLSKRRATTHNSPDPAANSQGMEAEMEQAKQAYKSKNTKTALGMFKKLYQKYPRHPDIPYFVGSCLLNEGNFESALVYFKICLTLDSNVNKNIYIYMAICYKALNRIKEAIEILGVGCERHPRFKDGLFYKGKIHFKRQQFTDAIAAFRKCLKIDPGDQLSRLFLADCLKSTGQLEEALQKYDSLIKDSQKYGPKATLKKIYTLLEAKKAKEASSMLKKATQASQSVQLTFLRGVCEYELGNYSEASTFLELSVASNIDEPHLGRALKLLLQIKIKEKDFLGAEHLISRAKFAGTKQQDMILYYKSVEGINDLIKRRLSECEEKLSYVYLHSQQQATDSEKFLLETGAAFYAYCLFSQEKYEKALEIYKKCRSRKESSKMEDYNVLVCEGVVLNKKKQYPAAEEKFKQASKLIQNKVEPIFLVCVNCVQENRDSFGDEEAKRKVFARLGREFKATEHVDPPNSLFLFYQSLVLLFQGKDACETIEKAISSSEEEISEYFFIQALALSLSGRTLKGLESINKAIELDHNIPEFYKERSKYFYVLERYEEAVTDVAGILEETGDEEAKLLITFYYYMTNEYGLSLEILREVSSQCSQDKFREFEMALQFRLHSYDKCGAAGSIILAIVKRAKLEDKVIEGIVEDHIHSRQTYSQFTVYYFHLLLSAYYFYRREYDSCLEHLFGALEEIQAGSEAEEQAALSETMLNKIKFNIALTSLMKEYSQEGQGDQGEQGEQGEQFVDTGKYLEMFVAETEDADFILAMNTILELIKFQKGAKEDRKCVRQIELYGHLPKLSDDLPEVSIEINRAAILKTKFLLLYPQKLRFNISPEFDESFLFNFDVDKIESKLCPPWFKLHQGHIFFTDQIRNESVLISETDKAPTPSLLSPTPLPQTLRDKFKLDEAVERKLQRIMRVDRGREG